MIVKLRFAVALLAGAFIVASAGAATIEKRFTGKTWYVAANAADDGDGSSARPFKTIQRAVDEATDNDKIRVAAGTYQTGLQEDSRICIRDKRLRIVGAGRDMTFIDGAGAYRGILLMTAANGSLFQNMTIRNCKTSGNGGGAQFDSSSGECYFVDCSFENCVSTGFGGAVNGPFVLIRTLIDRCSSSTPKNGAIQGCVGAYNMIAVACGRPGNTAAETCPVIGPDTFGPFINCTFAANLGYCVQQTIPQQHEKIVFRNTLFATQNQPMTTTNCDVRCSATTHNGELREGAGNFGTADEATWLSSPYQIVSPLNDWHLREGCELIDKGDSAACDADFIPLEYRATDFYGRDRIQGERVDIGAAEGGVAVECCEVKLDPNFTETNAKLTIDGRPVQIIANEGSNGVNRLYITGAHYPTTLMLDVNRGADEEIYGYLTTMTNMNRTGLYYIMLYPDLQGRTPLTLSRPADLLPPYVTISPILARAVKWVDPVNGVDHTVRGSQSLPYRTLQYAVDQSYDWTLIHALPGTYAEGGKKGSTDSDDTQTNITGNRVFFDKKCIRIVSTEGPEKTIIKGEFSTEGDKYDGCGSNAVRCVCFGSNPSSYGCVQGFTLTGGATAGDPTNKNHEHYDVPGSTEGGTDGHWDPGNTEARGNYGGGAMLCGIWNNNLMHGTVQDCIISNNVAYWGAATYGGIVRRCVIVDNRNVAPEKDKESTAIGYTCLQGLVSSCLLYGNRAYRFEFSQGSQLNCTIESVISGISLGGTVKNCIWNGMTYGTSGGHVIAGLRDPAHHNYHLAEGKPGLTAGNADVLFFGRLATTDLDGNLFDFSADGLPAGCYYGAVGVSHWYVDAVKGDNSRSGKSPDQAKRELNAILPLAISGDIVHAAEGVYNSGERVHSPCLVSAADAKHIIPAVGIVPEGVTLMADGDREKTIIEGKWGGVGEKSNPNYTETLQNMTFGEDAVRCLVAYADTRIKGFTLRNGGTLRTKYKDGTSVPNEEHRGAGVLGAETTVCEDCVFTNLVGYVWTAISGTAQYGGTAINCKFIRCGSDGAAVGTQMYLYNCYIDYCFDAPVQNARAVVNCTFGPNNKIGFGDGSSYVNWYCGAPLSMLSSGIIENTIQLSKSGSATGGLQTFNGAKNCVFVKDNLEAKYTIKNGQNNRFIALDDIVAGEEWRPILGSQFLDAGVVSALMNNEHAATVDLEGIPRIMNGEVDIGCREYDWRPQFAQDLQHKNVQVTGATAGVRHTADGNVLLTGDSTLLIDWPGDYGSYQGDVQVTGNGTLKIYDQDGWLIGSFTALDGRASFTLNNPDENTALTFVYEGGTGDATGTGAVLLPFRNFGGILLYSM